MYNMTKNEEATYNILLAAINSATNSDMNGRLYNLERFIKIMNLRYFTEKDVYYEEEEDN